MRDSSYRHVLNFGHRGASGLAPENTLAAFELAADLGADGVELDVQLSADGIVVVCHDSGVDRTTDGHGRVRYLTAGELAELDAGSWFGPDYATQHIPTLQEVIDRVGERLLLNVELKASILHQDDLARAVAAIIGENDLYDRVIVSSFNPLALRRLHAIDPRIDLGLLCWSGYPVYLRRLFLHAPSYYQAMHPDHVMVDQGFMTWARQRGYRVNTWTVDDPPEMRRLISLGVNMIISNRPDVVRRVLETEAG